MSWQFIGRLVADTFPKAFALTCLYMGRWVPCWPGSTEAAQSSEKGLPSHPRIVLPHHLQSKKVLKLRNTKDFFLPEQKYYRINPSKSKPDTSIRI
eukprot:1999379-Amphidinium_carterae.2